MLSEENQVCEEDEDESDDNKSEDNKLDGSERHLAATKDHSDTKQSNFQKISLLEEHKEARAVHSDEAILPVDHDDDEDEDNRGGDISPLPLEDETNRPASALVSSQDQASAVLRVEPKSRSRSLLKKARTASTSPKNTKKKVSIDESPESAKFTELVSQKYRDSIYQILDTAKTFFLAEFQEVLFEVQVPRTIEVKLAQAPGLLISLFHHMNEQKRRKRNSIKNRVTFSNVEEI